MAPIDHAALRQAINHHAAPVAAGMASLALLAEGVGVMPMTSVVTIGASLATLAFPIAISVRDRRGRRRHVEALRESHDLRRQLDRDPLTHLLNRGAFDAALDDLASAHSGHEVVVIFFDLDRFKDVNDTLGHKVGDQLLIDVAARATAVLEDASVLSRLGGDEFAAILRWNPVKRPEDYGQAIVEAISEPFVIDGRNVEVAASVGIAIGDGLIDDGHDLLRRADLAMYAAKGSPRGACRIYDDLLSGRQVRESSIRIELGKAIAEQAFTMHFQPIVDARTGRFSSAEALLRCQAPALADVPTATLIEVAEGSGQIMPLTDWTIGTVLDAIVRLENTPIAVNVSPVYFRHPDFVHRVFDRLLDSQVRPELLTIEVTEGVLIADIAAARHSITRLREIGVNVFLDDFGTGYSSLSYLQHFELDGLKLDRSFLREIGDKRKATQIIRSIIDFGHSLEMKVVVEGVESEWQARLLQLLGCDLLQGYDIGLPMPLDELAAIIDHAFIPPPGRPDLPDWNIPGATLLPGQSYS